MGSVFFGVLTPKKKLFGVVFWSFFRREAPIFFGVLSSFLEFYPARSAGVFFWSYFLEEKSARSAENYFLEFFVQKITI